MYYGRNSGGTHVFTAVPRDGEDILSIDEDFYPLFEFILEQAHKHPDTPDDLPKDPYLGIVELGSETWFSEGNVTFTAANFGMELDGDVEESSDDDADKNDTSDEGEENHAETLIGLPMFGYTVAIGLMVKALW